MAKRKRNKGHKPLHFRMTHRSTSLAGFSKKEVQRMVHALLTRHGPLSRRQIEGNLALIVHEARRKHRKLKQRYAAAKRHRKTRRHPKSRHHRKGR